MKNVLTVLILVGCLVLSSNAMAAVPLNLPSGSNGEAFKHNEEGITLYKAGKYEEAL